MLQLASRFVTFALLAWGGAALAADAPVLRIGLDPRTPPWSFVPGIDYSNEDFNATPALTPAQQKKLAGVDLDVARALARHMGAGLEIVPVSWFGMEEGLLAKRYDAILGSWTPSRKTPASIVASAPYYEWGLLIAVRADNTAVRSYRDLARVKVGHYRDPSVEATLRSLGAGDLVAMEAPELLFDALRKVELAAVVFDSVYVRWRVREDKAFRAVGEPLNRLGYHVGLRKDDTALIEQVQKAVKALVASPEIGEIRDKWEGKP